MHEYKTARSIFGFMEFLSWALVVVGVLIFSPASPADGRSPEPQAWSGLCPAF